MSALFEVRTPDADAPPMTERTMLDLVHRRFAESNGMAPRYVVAEHVGLDPTYPARRLDAVVADTWRSSAFALHGIEVKISRSDLVRELAVPSKAGVFCDHLDYFWIAVPDRKVLRGLTLPPKWGVLTVAFNTAGTELHLRSARSAKRLRPAVVNTLDTDPLPRKIQASMLRAVRKTYEKKAPV
jgi:hypothetical protein